MRHRDIFPLQRIWIGLQGLAKYTERWSFSRRPHYDTHVLWWCNSGRDLVYKPTNCRSWQAFRRRICWDYNNQDPSQGYGRPSDRESGEMCQLSACLYNGRVRIEARRKGQKQGGLTGVYKTHPNKSPVHKIVFIKLDGLPMRQVNQSNVLDAFEL